MSDELTTLAFQASQAASRYLRAARRWGIKEARA